MKIKFNQQPLPESWLSVAFKDPLLSQKLVKVLLPFTTIYLWETAFSALTNRTTKYSSWLVQSDFQTGVRHINNSGLQILRMCVLKNYILPLEIEPQVHIPMKILYKQQPLPKF